MPLRCKRAGDGAPRQERKGKDCDESGYADGWCDRGGSRIEDETKMSDPLWRP